MKTLSIEHSRWAYFGDFAVYLAAILAAPWMLYHFAPHRSLGATVGAIVVGLAIWSLIEYAMHRLVFHGIEPFQRMHGEHHRRPHALIATPTALSLAMITVLFWLPAILLAGIWFGSGATMGVAVGYFLYGVNHHAIHHWRARGAWMRRCKRLHAIHHRQPQYNYGVTMSCWDRIFHTGRQL